MSDSDKDARTILKNLCDKLDVIHNDTKDIFLIAAIHGCPYEGANWVEEYQAARNFLSNEGASSKLEPR